MQRSPSQWAAWSLALADLSEPPPTAYFFPDHASFLRTHGTLPNFLRDLAPHLILESVMSNSISRTSWKCWGPVTLWLVTTGARKGCNSDGGL